MTWVVYRLEKLTPLVVWVKAVLIAESRIETRLERLSDLVGLCAGRKRRLSSGPTVRLQRPLPPRGGMAANPLSIHQMKPVRTWR